MNCLMRRNIINMLKKCEKQLPSSREVRDSTELRYRDKNLPKILYESENLVVINKGYDIKVNSDDPTEMTVQHQLTKLFPQHVCSKITHGFRFVHRLDYATSGSLCVAFNKIANGKVTKEFENKRVTKHYLALVRGHIKDDIVFVNIPTGKLKDPDEPTWHRCCSVYDPRCSKHYITHTLIVCMERGQLNGEPVTKVLMRPYTGRTHQLRVHCDFIGHTIVGDFTYSQRKDTAPERMMLHAWQFKLRTSADNIDVTAKDPFTPETIPSWSVDDVIYTHDSAKEIAETFSFGESERVLKDRLKVYDSYTVGEFPESLVENI